MTDPSDLERFVVAQHDSYDIALGELKRGAKRSHWMWFIFPQVAGLGQSAMSRRYAIGSLKEAQDYLDHPLLGPRFTACVGALQDLDRTTAVEVLGAVDATKLRSSLTLFLEASGDPLIKAALDRWFDGKRDDRTLLLLGR